MVCAIACPIASPAARLAPVPAAPPSLAAAIGIACAAWYCAYRPMSPDHPHADPLVEPPLQLVGSDRLSTVKASSASPSSAKPGRSSAAMRLAHRPVLAPCRGTARRCSRTPAAMRVTTRLRSCGSRSAAR
jgi:hypothetical protein